MLPGGLGSRLQRSQKKYPGPRTSDASDFKAQRIMVIGYVEAGINYHWPLQVNGDNHYLAHRNGDLEVQVKRTDGDIWLYRIKVGEC